MWPLVTQHELHINDRVRQAMLAGAHDADQFREWADFLMDVGNGNIGEGWRRG